MRVIDTAAWKRRAQFEHFLAMAYPHFNVCADVDAARVRARARREGRSFYHSVVWAASRCANDIPEFRYRLRGREVVEHARVDPSFTVLLEGDVYSYCGVEYSEDREAFLDAAEARVAELRRDGPTLDDGGRDDLLYLTCLPWVSFNSVTHPVEIPADSVPRLAWGKLRERDGRLDLPFSVQVNHALMDGERVGRYFVRLQEILDEA
jgi:chloramphenicol O-acetyltransferase type A